MEEVDLPRPCSHWERFLHSSFWEGGDGPARPGIRKRLGHRLALFQGEGTRMTLVSARLQKRTWWWWAQILFFGVALAGFQLLLLAQAQKLSDWSATQWVPVGVGALVYMLLPTLAGFLTARQQSAPFSSLVAGYLVGGCASSFW